MLTLFQSKLGKNVLPTHILPFGWFTRIFFIGVLLDIHYYYYIIWVFLHSGFFVSLYLVAIRIMTAFPHRFSHPLKCCWMLCCVYKTTGALDIYGAFLFQQPTFICGERLKQKYSFLCYKAWHDLTRIRWRESKKNNGEWGKRSDCATQPKWAESRIWQLTCQLDAMHPFHDERNGRFIDILTIFQCCSIDLGARGPCAGSVECLDDHTVLGKFLQVVQGVDFAIAGGLHLHNAVLAVTAWAVFSITDLVTPDNAILKLLPGSLKSINQNSLQPFH